MESRNNFDGPEDVPELTEEQSRLVELGIWNPTEARLYCPEDGNNEDPQSMIHSERTTEEPYISTFRERSEAFGPKWRKKPDHLESSPHRNYTQERLLREQQSNGR